MLHHTSIHLDTDMVNVCNQSASSDIIQPSSYHEYLHEISHTHLDLLIRAQWQLVGHINGYHTVFGVLYVNGVCGGHSLVGLANGAGVTPHCHHRMGSDPNGLLCSKMEGHVFHWRHIRQLGLQ